MGSCRLNASESIRCETGGRRTRSTNSVGRPAVADINSGVFIFRAWPMPQGRKIKNFGFQNRAISMFNAVAGFSHSLAVAGLALTRCCGAATCCVTNRNWGGSMHSGAYVLFVRFGAQACRWAAGSRNHSAAVHRTHRRKHWLRVGCAALHVKGRHCNPGSGCSLRRVFAPEWVGYSGVFGGIRGIRAPLV